MSEIVSFTGAHRFLSNFWPVAIYAWGIQWPTLEHAYQASKASHLPREAEIWSRLREATSPGIAKRLGRNAPIRPDWDSVKLDIMFTLLMRKFQDPVLLGLLLGTSGSTLIEGNKWGDTFWGVCRGVGQNHLGVSLMRVRDIYQLTTQGL